MLKHTASKFNRSQLGKNAPQPGPQPGYKPQPRSQSRSQPKLINAIQN